VSLNDAEHRDRVIRLRTQLLDLLAGAEDDPMIFPGGLPEDPEERLKATSLLNADVLGNALGCTFLAHHHISNEHARQWCAHMLSIFVGLVKRELPEYGIDFEALGELSEQLSADPEIPEGLPPDIG